MRKKILVTGGAGFIGSHLCKYLLQQGDEVYCLDNFYTGSKDNILDLMENPYFEIIYHDITFPIYLEVDQIYNLACPASPVHYQKDPIQTTKTNVIGAINVLGMAKRLGARILQASTSEVYGNPIEHPQTEEYWGNVNCTGIRSCYDEGKRCAETLFFDYYRQLGTDIRVARIFNTYGPNMAVHDGRMISNFICQALNGDPLTIYGDGTQTRSICYVDDLVRGLVLLMNTENVIQPVNLGNPSEISVSRLAAEIRDKCESTSTFEYFDLPEDDPMQRCPDISHAKKTLNWQPKVSFHGGLDLTIDYFRAKLDQISIADQQTFYQF